MKQFNSIVFRSYTKQCQKRQMTLSNAFLNMLHLHLTMLKKSTKRTGSALAHAHSIVYNAIDKTFVHLSLEKSFQDSSLRCTKAERARHTPLFFCPENGSFPQCTSINSCYSRPVSCRGARASSQYSAIKATGKILDASSSAAVTSPLYGWGQVSL